MTSGLPNSSADPGPIGFFDDAARRIADAVTLHLTADPNGAAGRWLAFRLEDGRPDDTLYDSRSDLIRIKGAFANLWGALKILPMGMNYQAAASYLKFSRQVASNPNLRWKQTDVDAPEEVRESAIMLPNIEEIRRLTR